MELKYFRYGLLLTLLVTILYSRDSNWIKTKLKREPGTKELSRGCFDELKIKNGFNITLLDYISCHNNIGFNRQTWMHANITEVSHCFEDIFDLDSPTEYHTKLLLRKALPWLRTKRKHLAKYKAKI